MSIATLDRTFPSFMHIDDKVNSPAYDDEYTATPVSWAGDRSSQLA